MASWYTRDLMNFLGISTLGSATVNRCTFTSDPVVEISKGMTQCVYTRTVYLTCYSYARYRNAATGTTYTYFCRRYLLLYVGRRYISESYWVRKKLSLRIAHETLRRPCMNCCICRQTISTLSADSWFRTAQHADTQYFSSHDRSG